MMATLDDSPNCLIMQLLQTIVELARCERVMATREEFHFGCVYTFSAMPIAQIFVDLST